RLSRGAALRFQSAALTFIVETQASRPYRRLAFFFELRSQSDAVIASTGIGQRSDVEITVGASGSRHDEQIGETAGDSPVDVSRRHLQRIGLARTGKPGHPNIIALCGNARDAK